MKVKAQLNRLRIAPRKVRLVADLIRGQKVEKALLLLENTVKRSSDPLKKLLLSAVANAENNFKLNKDNLYITEIQIGEGPTLKRWMPRAYGRASKILKRTSNVNLIVEEVKEKDEKRKVRKNLANSKSAGVSQEKEEKNKKEIEKEEEAQLEKLTEGTEIVNKKIKASKKVLPREERIAHKKIVNPRNASRETGRTQKIFRKSKNK